MWYAIVLSNIIDENVLIPNYIMQALAHACKEIIDNDIKIKMIILNSKASKGQYIIMYSCQ